MSSAAVHGGPADSPGLHAARRNRTAGPRLWLVSQPATGCRRGGDKGGTIQVSCLTNSPFFFHFLTSDNFYCLVFLKVPFLPTEEGFSVMKMQFSEHIGFKETESGCWEGYPDLRVQMKKKLNCGKLQFLQENHPFGSHSLGPPLLWNFTHISIYTYELHGCSSYCIGEAHIV